MNTTKRQWNKIGFHPRPSAANPSVRLLAPGAFLSDTGTVRGLEFVRRIHALGKQRGIQVHWVAHRGKGSHGLLYFGSNMTTVRDLKDEIDTRAYHKMLKQLGLNDRDLA